MIHTSVFEPAFPVDVNNDALAAALGQDIKAIVKRKDRALATETLSKGMEKLVPELYAQGKFDGIISFGGSGGTSLVMPAIVDVAGLNKIPKLIFSNAVLAIVGMVNLRGGLKADTSEVKPLIAASMFGVTTPCVDRAKDYLEKRGYEVLVFHATGTGGKTMDALINTGFFAGVLDLTTTEWADQVVGGVLAAGEARCEAAIDKKIPQVVSVGACDMVNFGAIDTVPEKFSKCNLYKHNPTVTLMRTSVEECKQIAEKLAAKWNKAQVPMTVLLPKKGVSMIDADGQPFNGVEERKILFDTLKANIKNELVEISELDNNINDTDFAETAAKRLIELIEK